MAELIRYDAMCHAIAEAYEVDEAKDIRDKALAMQAYARQAKNVELERQACEIRLRAERRCGQLLKQMKAEGRMAKGGAPYHAVNRSGYDAEPVEGSLAEWKITKRQSFDWQGLAEVDDETFEDEVAKPGASTNGILNGQKKQHPVDLVDDEALWLWGRLQDFRREGLLDQDPATIGDTMLPHMRETVRELLPEVISWLQRIEL